MDHNRIETVWLWCTDAYTRHGRKLVMPRGTDPTKTYQWRYTTAIANKFSEWGLDDDAAQKFIDIAVLVAKERGLLHKGLAILHQADMLNLCYERLGIEATINTWTLTALRQIHTWVQHQAAGLDLYQVLLSRDDPGELPLISIWYHASHLSPLYLALSRPCRTALADLSSADRAALPSPATLYLLKTKFLQDRRNLAQVQAIFASDRRMPCQS